MTFEDVAKLLVADLFYMLGKPASSKLMEHMPCHSLKGIASIVSGNPISARPCPGANCLEKLAQINQYAAKLAAIAQTQGIMLNSQLNGNNLFTDLYMDHSKGSLYSAQLLLDSLTFVAVNVQEVCASSGDILRTRRVTLPEFEKLCGQANECARIIDRIKMQRPYSSIEEKEREHIERFRA